MFIESDITLMIDRLGWSENENLLYVDKLDDDNKMRSSGLTLNGFHRLVTVENVFNTQPNEQITNLELNSLLREVLDNVCREILLDVFVNDSRSKNTYSGTISDLISAGLFDNCIGYCHAVKILEIITSSVRSNRIEVITKANYAYIMGELKGRSTKEGVLVAKGLLHYCQEAREDIKNNIYGYSGVVIKDATGEW